MWYIIKKQDNVKVWETKEAETVILPGDQQLPNSIVMSSKATRPQVT